jgi:hypothetical protein
VSAPACVAGCPLLRYRLVSLVGAIFAVRVVELAGGFSGGWVVVVGGVCALGGACSIGTRYSARCCLVLVGVLLRAVSLVFVVVIAPFSARAQFSAAGRIAAPDWGRYRYPPSGRAFGPVPARPDGRSPSRRDAALAAGAGRPAGRERFDRGVAILSVEYSVD